MTPEEREISNGAVVYAKANRTALAKQLTSKERYPPDANPVSVFMSGSPGAGKTEASKAFLDEIEANNVIRLDPDDLRTYFPRYTGDNSFLFQSAVSLVVERTLDLAFKNNQSFLLDGTLSSVEVARKKHCASIAETERSTYFVRVSTSRTCLGVCPSSRARRGKKDLTRHIHPPVFRGSTSNTGTKARIWRSHKSGSFNQIE